MTALSEQLTGLASGWNTVEVAINCPLGAVTQLLKADPLRWAFLIGSTAQGGNPWQNFDFSTLNNPGTSGGFVINNALPILAMNYRDWGGLVQSAWFGFNNGLAAVTVTVITVRVQQ